MSSVQLVLIKRDTVDNCKSLKCTGHDCWGQIRSNAGEAASLSGTWKCHGLSLWQPQPKEGAGLITLDGSVPDMMITLDGSDPFKGEYCVAVAAEFDQEWAKQHRPDPNVSPRTIPARLR